MALRSVLKGYSDSHIDAMVHGARGAQLVVILYDHLVDVLGQAKLHMQRKEYRECGTHCAKALTIVAGLRETLDFERGEPVASELLDFYNAITLKIMGAQTRRDPAWLGEAYELVMSVREAWRQLADAQSTPSTKGFATVGQVGDDRSSAVALSGAGVVAAC
jgi:flagellar protein FliS